MQGCELLPSTGLAIGLSLPLSQDVLFWTKDKLEVEIVDFLLQLNNCIVCYHYYSIDKYNT